MHKQFGFGLIISFFCYLVLCILHIKKLGAKPLQQMQRTGALKRDTLRTFFVILVCLIAIANFRYNAGNLADLKEVYFSFLSGLYYHLRVDYITGGNQTPRAVQWGVWWIVNSIGLYIYYELLMKLRVFGKFDLRLVPVGFSCFLCALLTMQKAPVVLFAVGTLFVLLYPTQGRFKWSSKSTLGLVTLGFMAVCLSALLYQITGRDGNPFFAVWERFISVPIYTSYAHYSVFPESHDYIHYGGSRTMNLIFGFGQHAEFIVYQYSAAKIVAYSYFGSIFNANAAIVADGFANNGYLGVAQASLISFGLFFGIDFLISKKKNFLGYIPIAAFTISTISAITNGGLVIILYAYVPVFGYIFLVRGNSARV